MEVDPYLVGVLRGDGWTYDRGLGSYVTCIDQAEQNKHIIIDEVVPRFRRMGLWTKPYRYFAKHDGIFKWRSLVYSKALHQELKRIFSDMTSYIKSLSVKDFLLFIAGFFDAEGTMSYKRKQEACNLQPKSSLARRNATQTQRHWNRTNLYLQIQRGLRFDHNQKVVYQTLSEGSSCAQVQNAQVRPNQKVGTERIIFARLARGGTCFSKISTGL